jgi:hypothetical protein
MCSNGAAPDPEHDRVLVKLDKLGFQHASMMSKNMTNNPSNGTCKEESAKLFRGSDQAEGRSDDCPAKAAPGPLEWKVISLGDIGLDEIAPHSAAMDEDTFGRKNIALLNAIEGAELHSALEAMEAREILEAQDVSLWLEATPEDFESQEASSEEEADREQKVDQFLKLNGFSSLQSGGVKSKRRKMLQVSYPLHVAVAQKNEEMVQLLLGAGADPSVKNSWQRTPLQLGLNVLRLEVTHPIVCNLLRAESKSQ